ncbi:MAG: hypothetical protein EOM24_02985 [Chloroflexia bacterium]|nr:hypothetical protein [Chloroflexia bacterium]
MLDIVTFKWGQPNYRSNFRAEHVNTLKNMVKRNLSLPHRFICITDDPTGIDADTMPLWESPIQGLPADRPNCYRRLRLFSEEAREAFSPTIACIDLDTVITGDITPLFAGQEPFVIFNGTSKQTPYNGSFWILRDGSRRQVWDRLVPEAPHLTKGIVGSDQAWIAYVLGHGEATYGKAEGLYSYRLDFRLASQKRTLPDNCRMVSFHGRVDPWTRAALRASPWIEEHYR